MTVGRLKGRREALLAAVAAVAVVMLLTALGDSAVVRGLETASFDLRLRLRGVQAPGPEVVLVLVDDRSLAAALNCIRSRATAGRIAVRDIAQAAGLSLHTLQRRFRTRLGRTVQQEIARVRNETAQRLLLTPRLPMTAVAEHSGYESSPVFTRAFCRATGTTPLAFRRGGGERTSQ